MQRISTKALRDYLLESNDIRKVYEELLAICCDKKDKLSPEAKLLVRDIERGETCKK